MKKFIGFSAFISASILSVAFAFVIIPTAHAQVACPPGYTCTPIQPQPVNCPAGFTCTPVTPTNPISIEGSISITQNGSAPTGGVVACTPSVTCTSFTMTAGSSSNMKVNALSIDFNTRPWLYFSTFSLVNQSTGSILSPATLLTASNFTEITVGSDYRYVISIPNLVISPNQSANVLLIAKPRSGTVQNTNNVIYASVRATDSSGVTHTASTNSSSVSGIVASLDPASPIASTVQISQSVQTQNVALAVFDVKSQGEASTLQSLTLPLTTNNMNASQIFSNIQVKAEGLTYSASGIQADSYGDLVAKFNNMQIPLSADQYVPVTVYATVNSDTKGSISGSSVTVSLPETTNAIMAIDSNYNTVPMINSGTISGNTITFSSSGVQVSNTSATVGTETCNSTSNPTECDYPVSFNFSLTAGNNPIYIAKTGQCPAGYGCLANPLQFSGDITQIVMQTASVIPSTGDGSNYYYIAPGQTRQFTYSGVITNSNNYSSASTYTVQVSGISYGTNTNNLSSNSVTSGLSNLQVTASFNGGTTQQPTVTSINPTSGPVGSQITINGNNFQTGSVLKISGPSLNNFGVIPNSVSPTQIIAYMPSQATYSGVYAIYVSNGNVTSNTVQFTIQSTSTQPPVITGGTFPTTLQVNQTGAWSVSAYDPQNGSLSYAVDWGDNAPKPAYVTQTTAFTHSYSAAGNYTVKFTVTNSAGLTAQTSATVQVANPITATCPVGYICGPVGQAISCPSGYICTNVTANCPSGYICSVANKVTSSPSPTPTPSSSSSPSPSSSSAPQAVQYDAGSQPAAAVQSTGSGFWSTLFKSLGF